jgi:hypothetical protein
MILSSHKQQTAGNIVNISFKLFSWVPFFISSKLKAGKIRPFNLINIYLIIDVTLLRNLSPLKIE